MKRLTEWIRTYPTGTALNMSALLMMGVFVWFLPDDSWLVMAVAAAFVVFVTAWAYVIWRVPVVCVILAMAFVAPTAHAQQPEQPGGDGGGQVAGGCAAAAVAVVVVAVGGYCLYRVVKFCQKKFPKASAQTNTVEETEFTLAGGYGGAAGGGNSDAAALNFAELGSCPQEDFFCNDQDYPDGAGGSGATMPNLTTVSLTLTVDHGQEPGEASFVSTFRCQNGLEPTIDWSDFCRDARANGVSLTGHAGDFSFARNGEPIPASQSPISWDPVRKLIRITRGSATYYTVVVERSANLRTWTEVLRTEVEVGTTIELLDTNPAESQFYRYSGVLSD